MKLEIASSNRDHAILVCDEHSNDIAEFYHSDHATVTQSYETALALAKQLVEGSRALAQSSAQMSERINVIVRDYGLEKSSASETHDALIAVLGVAQTQRGDLTKIAAECHRAKWQFDLSEDFQPSKASARALILKAFHELHRIGDAAMKLRDASPVTSTDKAPKPYEGHGFRKNPHSAADFCALCGAPENLHGPVPSKDQP